MGVQRPDKTCVMLACMLTRLPVQSRRDSVLLKVEKIAWKVIRGKALGLGKGESPLEYIVTILVIIQVTQSLPLDTPLYYTRAACIESLLSYYSFFSLQIVTMFWVPYFLSVLVGAVAGSESAQIVPRAFIVEYEDVSVVIATENHQYRLLNICSKPYPPWTMLEQPRL